MTAAEEAAEARDASALKALVADDYADPAGRGAAEVRNFLHGWLLAHQSVHLLTRVDAIELEGTEQAKLSVTVAMLGREAEAESAWELAGDLYHLELRLARVDGEWRAIRAGPRAN